MPYKDLYTAIVKGKLYATRSSNFDNVRAANPLDE